MKNAIIAGLLFGMAHGISVPVQAQQVNEFQTCTRHREVYTPGRYDGRGNYIQGRLSTQSYKVPCDGDVVNYVPNTRQEPTRRRPQCDPAHTTLGALLGGGVGAALSRGDGRYWAIPVGAAVGGGMFGCT